MLCSGTLLLCVSLLIHISYAKASLALTNARVYTVDDSNPWAEAVLIDDDGFLAVVGTNEEVQTAIPDGTTRSVDLEGRLLLPGFQDAHLHAVEAGINADLCYIEPEAVLEDIPFYFDDCPDGGIFADQGWVVGAGIDVQRLIFELEEDPTLNPIAVLDEFYPDTPVLILDSLGHGAIANSVAMNLAGYGDPQAGDPPGGLLIRHPDTNQHVGIVLENAQQKLRDAAFPPTVENKQTAYESLLDALDLLAQNGITTVSDAGGFYRQAQTETWKRAEAAGVLTVRASNALYIYPDVPLDEQMPELTSRYSNDPNALVRFNQAKIYVDGILSLTTGAVYEPYSASLQLPEEERYGFEYFGNSTTLFDASRTLSNAGFQLHFHVTGDRGTSLALDAIERSSPVSGPHRLTHCYLVNEADRGRFEELDAIADFQLAPSSLSADYSNFIAELTSPELAATLLPALEVFNAGGTITLSSDWDADVLSPLAKMKAVLTRPDGRSFPNLEVVIPMLTINPARLLLHDDKTGSLVVGKAADLVVLDNNIFDVAVNEIDSVKVLATMLQGDVVYDAQGILGEVIGSTSGASSIHHSWSGCAVVGTLGVFFLRWLVPILDF